jgi:hypothetical protein
MKWESYSHPLSDVRDWNTNKRLELQPDFQRKVVWTKSAQIMLIETIFMDIPIPKIYIKSVIREQKTYRIVIDGQQRLTSILSFLNDKLKLSNPYSGEYKGKVFSQLPENVQNNILRYKIDINEINDPTEDEIRDLYSRVNKYTVQLNKQELRKADFPGEFLRLSSKMAELEFFEDGKIFTIAQRRRMLDVEFISELLVLLIAGEQDKKEYLDDFYEGNSVMTNPTYEELKILFESIINDLSNIFNSNLQIVKTRFKQKSDFYTLVGCINQLKKEGLKLQLERIPDLQEIMIRLDKDIIPHSQDETMRSYALHCLSDANSLGSRKWRKNFLIDFIKKVYC